MGIKVSSNALFDWALTIFLILLLGSCTVHSVYKEWKQTVTCEETK